MRKQSFLTYGIALALSVSVITQYTALNHIQSKINIYENQLKAYSDKIFLYEEKLDEIEQEMDQCCQCSIVLLIQTKKEVVNQQKEEVVSPSKNENVSQPQKENNPYERLYYGRLYVPDAKISVALYSGDDQNITDRHDSANIYSYKGFIGHTIADHKNQEFGKLYNVDVGTQGYIELKDGSVINIECVDIFSGHNVEYAITDEFGNNVYGRSDYMMYTCKDHWSNVHICLWNEI